MSKSQTVVSSGGTDKGPVNRRDRQVIRVCPNIKLDLAARTRMDGTTVPSIHARSLVDNDDDDGKFNIAPMKSSDKIKN